MSVWDGVYTPAQANRGYSVYVTHCDSCHGSGLTANSAALIGESFWQKWGEDSLASFLDAIRTAMPSDTPGSLTDREYVDVVAYVLQVNHLPAGTTELSWEATPRIRVQGKAGPGPVPNSALVRVAGCLTQRSDGAWILTHSSEPVRTRNPEAEGEEAGALSLGTGVFRLLSVYPSPLPHLGHLMEVKGLLIRETENNRLNVTSIKMLEPACGT